MKQYALGQPPYFYRRLLRRRIGLCAALVLGVLILHGCLVSARTEDNHNALLVLNMAVDWLCGGFLVYYISLHIAPGRTLYRLTQRPAQTLDATVTDLSDAPVRYMGIDCVRVSLDGKTVFLPRGSLTLQKGLHCRFKLVSNLIVEVEV